VGEPHLSSESKHITSPAGGALSLQVAIVTIKNNENGQGLHLRKSPAQKHTVNSVMLFLLVSLDQETLPQFHDLLSANTCHTQFLNVLVVSPS
jgi:hypothetical protein